MSIGIEPLSDVDRPWAERLISRYFVSPQIVSRGRLHDVRGLPGLVAVDNGLPCGVLVYDPADPPNWEVLVLLAEPSRRGTGRLLLQAIVGQARTAGCKRLWLTTTNDNGSAIAFYQSSGWQMAAVHEGAMAEARRIKPDIPELADDGTPITDEIEFELLL